MDFLTDIYPSKNPLAGQTIDLVVARKCDTGASLKKTPPNCVDASQSMVFPQVVFPEGHRRCPSGKTTKKTSLLFSATHPLRRNSKKCPQAKLGGTFYCFKIRDRQPAEWQPLFQCSPTETGCHPDRSAHRRQFYDRLDGAGLDRE